MKNVIFIALSCLPTFLMGFGPLKNDEVYQEMDRLASKAGTDKGSSFHNYTKVYSKWLSSLKDEPIKFLEIGIYLGDSVKFWESYFSQAELHFMDIDLQRPLYHSERSQYHLIDQENHQQLVDFASVHQGNFDVILDDGGHTMHQQLVSFLALFPFVKNGGMYIIEDLHTSYWKNYGGHGEIGNPVAGEGTMTEFLKKLVDDVNYPGAFTACGDFEKLPESVRLSLNHFQQTIESLHFYDSVCIIIKR